jgi:hypothetical protein
VLKQTSTTVQSVKEGKLNSVGVFGWNTAGCMSLVSWKTGSYKIDYNGKFQV